MTMQRPNADLKSLYPLHVWKDVYGLLLSLDKFSPNDFRAPHGYFVLDRGNRPCTLPSPPAV